MRHARLPVFRLSIVSALMWAALMVATPAEALEGRVVDRLTGRPIAGAEVGIVGLSGTVRTGTDGSFVWTPDPPLPFVVLVMLPGGKLAKPVKVLTRTGASPILIDVDPVLAETVVIAGSAPSVEASPGASTALISSLDIERRSPANIMQALENVVGVSSVAEGQSAVPAIRGLARGRTLMLLDGGRLFSERRAGPSVSFLSPDNLDRIDVVRGPASVAYGSDAFGGVISLVTHRPSEGAPFNATVTSTFGAGLPAQRVEAQVSTGLGTRASLLVEARNRNAGEYSSPNGLVPNSAWRDSGALVRLGFRAGGWWTAAWQGDAVRDNGLPRSDVATLRVTTPFERSSRGSASFDRTGLPWFGHLTVTGHVGRYAQRLDQDRLPAPGRPRRIDRSDIDATDVELRAVARTGLGHGRLSIGGDVTDRQDLRAHDIAFVFDAAGNLTAVTDNASIASARKRDTGAFAQFDLPLAARLTVAAGGRFDHVRGVNTGGFFGDRTVSHDAASGSASLAYRPTSALTIIVQASRGFRDPTLSDRFFRGPVGRGFITGNPDLLPEHSLQFDLAAHYNAGRWRASASYYHYDISNLIERYQSGADSFLFRNRGLAKIRGVEVEAAFDVFHGTTLEVSGETARGRAEDDGATLDDIAPARAIVQIRQALGTRVFVSARAAAIAADSTPGPSEVATPGYVDAGVTASWRTFRWLELRLAATNLLNQRYYSSPSSRGVLAPGRYATVTFVVTFR